MKQKFIDYYMKIADATAELSYATRLKVGSVIVKDNRILATGYNGMPSGWDNTCEDTEFVVSSEVSFSDEMMQSMGYTKTDAGNYTKLVTKPEVLHSETNAIAKVSQSTESSKDSTMFCTHAPCIECAKLIYQSGIKTLYYKEEYRNDKGLIFLKLSGVNVHKYRAI